MTELDKSGIRFVARLQAQFAANKIDPEVELLDCPTTDGFAVVEHSSIRLLDQKTQDELRRLSGASDDKL